MALDAGTDISTAEFMTHAKSEESPSVTAIAQSAIMAPIVRSQPPVAAAMLTAGMMMPSKTPAAARLPFASATGGPPECVGKTPVATTASLIDATATPVMVATAAATLMPPKQPTTAAVAAAMGTQGTIVMTVIAPQIFRALLADFAAAIRAAIQIGMKSLKPPAAALPAIVASLPVRNRPNGPSHQETARTTQYGNSIHGLLRPIQTR